MRSAPASAVGFGIWSPKCLRKVLTDGIDTRLKKLIDESCGQAAFKKRKGLVAGKNNCVIFKNQTAIRQTFLKSNN